MIENDKTTTKNKQTGRHHRQKKQTDRQTDRQTDTQTDITNKNNK